MKENKLKKMAENNKFEELMNNTKELERLSKIKDISEVLDILNKYGYNGNKNELERDLFEILQGLSEDDLKNISGGKILNKKYLAGLMGGLTMMGAMGLNTSAHAENQSKVKTKSDTSFFNKVDKTVVGVAAGSLAVGGFFVEAMNLLFRKDKIECRDRDPEVAKKQTVENVITKIDLPLTEEEQEIYNETVKLSKMLLDYAKEYFKPKNEYVSLPLDKSKPDHVEMLEQIKKVRVDFAHMYENDTGKTLPDKAYQRIAENTEGSLGNNLYIKSVELSIDSIFDVFYGLPIGNTEMFENCSPDDLTACYKKIPLIVKLNQVADQYYTTYAGLIPKMKLTRNDAFITKQCFGVYWMFKNMK